MIDYKKIFRDREKRLKLIKKLSFIPDVPYLKMVYRIKTGKKLNLDDPKTFNEKLNWLKLHDIHPEYTDLVDKIKVREIIKEKLGEEYLFPLLGVWDSFDEIDFDTLPDRFVLKCNHDSGSVKVITDKSRINKPELKKFFDGRLSLNPWCLAREYPYKNVKPKIIAEQYMEAKDGKGINDYKFLCFNGKPEIVFVATGRPVDTRFDYFDMEYHHLDVKESYENADVTPKKPACFDEMKKIAFQLCQGKTEVRVDLYEIDGKVYFGELTFFDGGGYNRYEPNVWDRKIGDMLDLSNVKD